MRAMYLALALVSLSSALCGANSVLSTMPLQEIALLDPARKGRTVQAKLCLPEKNGMSPASPLPLLIYGHGFDCNPQDYAYYCQFAATAMVYNMTWDGKPYNPGYDSDTANLAVDAVFLATELQRQAKGNSSSPLFGRLGGATFLGGHSMGGGVSVLAAGASPPPPILGMYLNAPGLYTNPDATPFLKNITIPSIIISGSDDCGPNALPHQAEPAYKGLASKRKVLLVLKGANHCGWTTITEPLDHGFVCTMDECSHMNRETQHRWGVAIAKAFTEAVTPSVTGADGWQAFEKFLAAGEANGTWTYLSSVTSPPSKALHNDCPCNQSSVYHYRSVVV